MCPLFGRRGWETMAGMFSYSKTAMERAMKVQESFCEPWRIRSRGGRPRKVIGISDRHMRRWREHYEELGYDGLFDRRRGHARFGARIYVNHVWVSFSWGATMRRSPAAVRTSCSLQRNAPIEEIAAIGITVAECEAKHV